MIYSHVLKILFTSVVVLCIIENEEYSYRLKQTLIPIHYDLHLMLKSDFIQSESFRGESVIHVKTEESTKSFEIHAFGLNLTSVNVKDKFGHVTLTNSIKYNLSTQTFKIFLSERLKVNERYSLMMNYKGVFYDDMHGFYLSRYNNEVGKNVWIASTHFEPIYARRVFPCFDEPDKKATFQLSVTKPKNLSCWFNTPKISLRSMSTELEKHTFKTTPKMAPYALAFVIADYIGINNPFSNISVWGRKEVINDGFYALDQATKLLLFFNNYLGVPYNSMGITKIDLIAIPDYFAGATETWGIITFREYFLMWNSQESSYYFQKKVSNTIAHELAHMWFGNLVTCSWWSYVWLNEGFAKYWEYLALSHVESSWDMENQFVVDVTQEVLLVDSYSSSKPLNFEVFTPEQIKSKFGKISYYKGACIIKMAKHFLGETIFQQGIKKYILENQHSNTMPKNIWYIFTKLVNYAQLPSSMSNIMRTWTDQPGYPVVYVERVNNSHIFLTQKRHLLQYKSENVSSDLEYYIPITFTNSSLKNFDSVEPQGWITPNKNLTILNVISKSGWIIVNIKVSGFYRVNYEETLWKRLIDALNSPKYDKIHVINRAQLIDDSLNLARLGILPYNMALELTDYLQNETEYYPWCSAIRAFSYLLKGLVNNNFLQDYLKKLTTKIEKQIFQNFNRLTSKMSSTDLLLWREILSFLCNLEVESCFNESRILFENFKNNGNPINPNVKDIVYCNALKASNDSTDWSFLWNRYLKSTSSSETKIILNALTCTNDNQLLTKYLKKSISDDSKINLHDSVDIYRSIYGNRCDGAYFVFKFIKENFNKFNGHFSVGSFSNIIFLEIIDKMITSDQISELEKFIEVKSDLFGNSLNKIKNAIQRTKDKIGWFKVHSKVISDCIKVRMERYAQVITENDAVTEKTPKNAQNRLIAQFIITMFCPLITFYCTLFSYLTSLCGELYKKNKDK